MGGGVAVPGLGDGCCADITRMDEPAARNRKVNVAATRAIDLLAIKCGMRQDQSLFILKFNLLPPAFGSWPEHNTYIHFPERRLKTMQIRSLVP